MEPTTFDPRLKFKPRLKFFKFGLRAKTLFVDNDYICESIFPADTAHLADMIEQLHLTEELGWKLKIPITGGLKQNVGKN